MKGLKVNKLGELAASLAPSAQISKNAQCNVKGGCSSCEDTRRPPKILSWLLDNGNGNSQ